MILPLNPRINDIGQQAEDSYSKSLDREDKQDQWTLLLESLQFFLVGSLFVFILEGLCAAILLYVRNRRFVQNKDYSCNSSLGGLSSPSFDNRNLYPILNLAGENKITYIKRLDSEQFMEIEYNANRKERSEIRIKYSMAELLMLRDITDLSKVHTHSDFSRIIKGNYNEKGKEGQCIKLLK